MSKNRLYIFSNKKCFYMLGRKVVWQIHIKIFFYPSPCFSGVVKNVSSVGVNYLWRIHIKKIFPVQILIFCDKFTLKKFIETNLTPGNIFSLHNFYPHNSHLFQGNKFPHLLHPKRHHRPSLQNRQITKRAGNSFPSFPRAFRSSQTSVTKKCRNVRFSF